MVILSRLILRSQSFQIFKRGASRFDRMLHFVYLAQLQYQRILSWRGTKQIYGGCPVDGPSIREQMRIARAVVVMNVRRTDARLQQPILIFDTAAHMSMAYVKTDV